MSLEWTCFFICAVVRFHRSLPLTTSKKKHAKSNSICKKFFPLITLNEKKKTQNKKWLQSVPRRRKTCWDVRFFPNTNINNNNIKVSKVIGSLTKINVEFYALTILSHLKTVQIWMISFNIESILASSFSIKLHELCV